MIPQNRKAAHPGHKSSTVDGRPISEFTTALTSRLQKEFLEANPTEIAPDMGINSLTHRDDGSRVAVPVSTDDWPQWVSAGKTRNWMLDDPLIDWLQLYGKTRDYLLKQELAGYDEDLDFLEFIFDKGREFETGILRLFQAQHDVTTVAQDYREISSLSKAEETFKAMKQGLPIIYQAVLWDAHNLTYGSPDFLVRSDVLRELFPESISEQDAAVSAPDLGSNGASMFTGLPKSENVVITSDSTVFNWPV